jgi:hypothetical protein
MPAERTTMRQVRGILRLKFVGNVPLRKIAHRVRVTTSTVRAPAKCVEVAGLSWPLPDEMTDAALEERLIATTAPSRDIPDKSSRIGQPCIASSSAST